MDIISPIVACAFLLVGEGEERLGADPNLKVALKSTPGLPLESTNVLPGLPKPQFRTHPEFGKSRLSMGGTNGIPGPGVYKTEPFTCLVLVPGWHADDIALSPGPEWPRIRQHTPDLRFVPRR